MIFSNFKNEFDYILFYESRNNLETGTVDTIVIGK
jgi:hypothetical protein